MPEVNYRSTPGPGLRRTKLKVPGWGDQREPRKNGSMKQAWHCLPFSEGPRYGRAKGGTGAMADVSNFAARASSRALPGYPQKDSSAHRV
jgi:hypothetical protein